jgi:hypothetical protein
VVAIAEIKACEKLCVTTLIDEFGDKWERVAVLDGDLIQTPVVDV